MFTRKHHKALSKFIKKYELHWYSITALLYFLSIPLTIWVFPATTLLLTIVVLFGGFTSSIASLASITMATEQDEKIKEATSEKDNDLS